MKKFVLLLVTVLLPVCIFAQERDADLMLGADFSSKIIKEDVPRGITPVEKAMHSVSVQLTGECRFDPACYLFFAKAVKELGLIPAFFATTDRILRCTRIGMSGEHFDASHTHVEEGPEAYKIRKR